MAVESLRTVSELEATLISAGYTDSRRALALVRSLKKELTAASTSAAPVNVSSPSSDYTASRAEALRNIGLKLKKVLSGAKVRSVSYSNRAYTLSVVADNYLKLTHAFKVDNNVWIQAQTELVPLLSSVSDEKSIDAAIVAVDRHIDSYLTSLSSWLSR